MLTAACCGSTNPGSGIPSAPAGQFAGDAFDLGAKCFGLWAPCLDLDGFDRAELGWFEVGTDAVNSRAVGPVQ